MTEMVASGLMRGAGDGVMDRSRETLAREGRNGLASHALFATAPAPYFYCTRLVPSSCRGTKGGITDSAHGILKQEDEPAFEDVSCPILSGVGVRLWRGLEVGWHHP